MSERETWSIGGAGVIDERTLRRYRMAGFGGPIGIGSRPALLIIDVQYRSVGFRRVPVEQSIEEFPTSCGDIGWDAVDRIATLLEKFRAAGWPVFHAYVAPKESFDSGRLRAKMPRVMSMPAHGYDFVNETAPAVGEILLPKRHPSAFFGTPLTSYLIDAGVDSLVIVGCTTSGCVRSSVVDAFSYNYKVFVPADAVYDRSPVVHEVNLFDMAQKYADVTTSRALLQMLDRLCEVSSTVGD